MDAECLQLFIQIMVHEVGQVKRAFPAEFFNRGGINVAEGQVEGLLSGEPQASQIRVLWKNVPELNMLVLQRAFLPGLHGVTVEHPGPPCAASPGPHCSSSKFGAPISKQDMDVFSEEPCAQDGFQKVNTIFHGLCGPDFVIDGKQDTGIHKFKGLDKRAAGLVIIDGIHLRDKDVRIFRYIFPVILISASLEIFAVSPLFISFGFLGGNLTGNLAAQVHDGNAGNLVEHIVFDVIVKGLSEMPSSG